MAFDIYDFVFYEILKYDYSSSVLTGELQHDIVFGLMIPTIFIAIIVYTGVHKIFGEAHKFIGYLSSITAVGVIMTLGWAPIIAGIGAPLFVILIALYFMSGFYRRFISHGHEKKLVDVAGWAGSKIDMGNPMLTKKDRRRLATELRNANREFEYASNLLKGLLEGTVKTRDVTTAGENVKSQEQRQKEIKSMAIDTAEEIVSRVPRGERKQFIIDNAKNDEFKKELMQLFLIKDQI